MENTAPPAYSTYEQSARNPEFTQPAPVYHNFAQPGLQVGGNVGVPGSVYQAYPGTAGVPGQPYVVGAGTQPTAVIIQPSCYTDTGHVHCSTNSYLQARRNGKCVCIIVFVLLILPVIIFFIVAGATGMFSGKW